MIQHQAEQPRGTSVPKRNQDAGMVPDTESSSSEEEEEDAHQLQPRRSVRRVGRPFRNKKQLGQDEKMDRVRHQLVKNTYRVEGEAILLHGYLKITIIRAKGLRNADFWKAIIYNQLVCNCSKSPKEASDSYVTVHAGSDRLLKTKIIPDELNPQWNQTFCIPVCHYITELEFRVKDWDQFGSDNLGTTRLSVHELIAFRNENEDDPFCAKRNVLLQRKGVHKTVFLDGHPSHGSLEYSVDFVPQDLLHRPASSSMQVPNLYFSMRQPNRLRFYVNADDNGKNPPVTYGEEQHRKIWKPRRFFRDIYDAWCHAKHMIYVVGWSVDYTISLLRGEEATQGLCHNPNDGTPYSPILGELLNQKANEGVVVNLLVWDDNTSNSMHAQGVVATRDEELRHYFQESKVHLKLVPMGAGNANMLKRFRNSVYYTHHQKCVICDTPQQELVAFVGGIDLTYGRYDDGSYPLFRTLDTVHKDDFHQACFAVPPKSGPREPWHDIHSRVKGAATLDLLQNFEERWIGQGGLPSQLVVLDKIGVSTYPKGQSGDLDEEEEDNWCTQLFRSIDAKTAKLVEPNFEHKSFRETPGVEFSEEKELKRGKRKTAMQKILKTGPEREQHFVGKDGNGSQENIPVLRPLDYKRDLKIDSSVHKGLVHHIRNAQHSIYIESQYFLSSSFLWDDEKSSRCCNMIAAEITLKICEKIDSGERFAAYVVLPMWPEGISDSSSVQDILHYQAITMRSMFRRIQKSIDRQRLKLKGYSSEAFQGFADVTPTDYLNFYCLANREALKEGDPVGGTDVLSKTRRHMIYTHSKMTIIDDAIIICGSANINQRSMDGNRDSELLMASWQPNHMATTESVARGDVHGFRLYCWAHLTGSMEEVFRNPQTLECVRRINAIAKRNWQMFSRDDVVEMTSYLTSYPIDISCDGNVFPKTSNGEFPDTQANILGSSKPSLPKFLTT